MVRVDSKRDKRFTFPRWSNTVRPCIAAGLLLGPVYLVALIYYAFNPTTTSARYMPEQPVEYSHALHAGDLDIDCRYCHYTVEEGAAAAIPPTQICMNCHATIKGESEKLASIRESFDTGMPVRWVRVHDLPDFVYFDHSAHVTRGVGCVSCHGRIDRMETVSQEGRLSMGWCLDCHREPEEHIRPVAEMTNMTWEPAEDRAELGRQLCEEKNLKPSLDCSVCHR